MTRGSTQPNALGYLGFVIREHDGVYVAVFMRAEKSAVFEAETRTILEHKIRRWWVIAQ